MNRLSLYENNDNELASEHIIDDSKKRESLFSNTSQYYEILGKFSLEAKQIIDNIIKDAAMQKKKDHLIKLIQSILANQADELDKALRERKSASFSQHNLHTYTNQQPCMNLILFYPRYFSIMPPNYSQYLQFNSNTLNYGNYPNSMNSIYQSYNNYYTPYQIQAAQIPQQFPIFNNNSNPLPLKPKNHKKSKKEKSLKKSKKEKTKSTKKNKKELLKEDPNGRKEISVDPSNHFNGIIEFIRKSSTAGIQSEISVTASSTDFEYRPENVIEYVDSLFESTPHDKNPWLCIEFKKRRVILKSYTIKSGWWEKNNWHLKSWVIEGSNDKSTWEILDDQRDCNYLNGSHFIHNFQIQRQTGKEFRYLRIRKTGPNWFRNNLSLRNKMVFDSIEFYGTLI